MKSPLALLVAVMGVIVLSGVIVMQNGTISQQKDLIHKLYKDAWGRPAAVVPQNIPAIS
jgi:hypothetical protein